MKKGKKRESGELFLKPVVSMEHKIGRYQPGSLLQPGKERRGEVNCVVFSTVHALEHVEVDDL